MKVSGNCEIKTAPLAKGGIDLQVKLGRSGTFCSLRLDKKQAVEFALMILEAIRAE
jgi:hypothetical protein